MPASLARRRWSGAVERPDDRSTRPTRLADPLGTIVIAAHRNESARALTHPRSSTSRANSWRKREDPRRSPRCGGSHLRSSTGVRQAQILQGPMRPSPSRLRASESPAPTGYPALLIGLTPPMTRRAMAHAARCTRRHVHAPPGARAFAGSTPRSRWARRGAAPPRPARPVAARPAAVPGAIDGSTSATHTPRESAPLAKSLRRGQGR